ncbi:MAG: hypothetical protein H6642_06655 [Caldilineaceae bacterium]|nr:hypothetical protein [Caldilineaceae bacterium]
MDANSLPDAVAEEPCIPLWRDRLFWLTLALTIFAAAPFLQPGYFWGANDARHHVYFLFEFDRLVQDGIWWPRWSPDFAFGYGYPFFNIYGPFSHFLGELLHHFLGLDFVPAVKSVFVISIVASAATMYAFVRSWGGRRAAVISALVYVYIPYHLFNLYVRANLAESMALAWLPFCLLAVRMAMLRGSRPWIVMTAVAYAGLFLTSNLIVVLFTPVLGLYILTLVLVYARPDGTVNLTLPGGIRFWPWLRRTLAPAAGILLGLGLSAVFWLPMLLERRYVRVDQWFDGRYDYRGNFVYFYQLFSPIWGFGVSEAGPNDQIGFQLGVIALTLALLGIVLSWRRLERVRGEMACFIAAGLLALLAGLEWGRALWELPLLGTILGFAQFPWRWFSIVALCLSILSGLILHPAVLPAPRRGLDAGLLILAGLIILAGYPYLQVEIVEPAEGPVSLAGLMRFQQTSDEMTGSTAWVKEIPTWSPMADYYINQDQAGGPVEPVTTMIDYGNPRYPIDNETLAIGSVAHNTVMEELYFFNTRSDEQRVVFNQFYYPGWRAYLLDGEHGAMLRELPIIPEEEGTLGRMTVPLPQGEGYILLRYGDTPARAIGRAVSLATLAFLLLTTFFAFWRRQNSTT